MSLAASVDKKLILSFHPSGIHLHLKRSQTAAGQTPEAPALSFGKTTLIFPMWTREPSNQVEFPPCCFLEGSFLSWSSAKHTEIHSGKPLQMRKIVLNSEILLSEGLCPGQFWIFISPWDGRCWHDETRFASWKCRCVLQHLSPFGALVLGSLEGLV